MRSTLLTLAVAIAAVAALGIGGAVADGPSTDETDGALPADHEIDVVDPDGDLSNADVTDAIDLAWANDEVRATIEDSDPLEFTVWAKDHPDGETDASVWVSELDDPAHAVVADVDLDADSIVEVTEPTEITADEMQVENVSLVEADSTEGSVVTFSVENGTVGDRFEVSTDKRGSTEGDRQFSTGSSVTYDVVDYTPETVSHALFGVLPDGTA